MNRGGLLLLLILSLVIAPTVGLATGRQVALEDDPTIFLKNNFSVPSGYKVKDALVLLPSFGLQHLLKTNNDNALTLDRHIYRLRVEHQADPFRNLRIERQGILKTIRFQDEDKASINSLQVAAKLLINIHEVGISLLGYLDVEAASYTEPDVSFFSLSENKLTATLGIGFSIGGYKLPLATFKGGQLTIKPELGFTIAQNLYAHLDIDTEHFARSYNLLSSWRLVTGFKLEVEYKSEVGVATVVDLPLYLTTTETLYTQKEKSPANPIQKSLVPATGLSFSVLFSDYLSFKIIYKVSFYFNDELDRGYSYQENDSYLVLDKAYLEHTFAIRAKFSI